MSRSTWPIAGLFIVVLTVSNYAVSGDVWSLSFLGFGVVGSYVAWKVPGHVTGRLMIGLSAVSALADSEALEALIPATRWVGVAMPLLMGLFLLTFPAGRLVRSWWRPIALVALGVTIIGVFVAQTTGDEGPYVIVPLVAFLLGAAADLITRYRRADGRERMQMKYVVFATIATASLLVLPGLFDSLGFLGMSDILYDLIVVLGFTLFPLAIGGAILRYRLYEIDRIISRTVSYTLVVALLGLLFASGAIWIPTALDLGDSPLLVAGTTLAVAGLFNPLRKRIQRTVDRRFNRSSHRAEQVSDDLAQRLRDTHTVDELANTWGETVDDYFEPAASGIWVKEHRERAATQPVNIHLS